MNDLNKDIKRALNKTVFASNPYDPSEKKEVIKKMREKNRFVHTSVRRYSLTPIFSMAIVAAILIIFAVHYMEGGSPTSPDPTPTSPPPLETAPSEDEEPLDEEELVDEDQTIRDMIGKKVDSELEDIYRRGDSFPITRMTDFDESFFKVDHYLVDGVDTNNVGVIFESGFVPLPIASESYVRSRLPSPSYPDDVVVDDAFTEEQVIKLKKQFYEELQFIFPAGKYNGGELLQVSFLIQSTNNEQAFLEEVVTAIKEEFPETPVTVLFTVVETNHFLVEHAIGYFNEEVHIHYLDDVSRSSIKDLSMHLSETFNLFLDETTNGVNSSFPLIEAHGFHNGSGEYSSVEISSTVAKSVTLLVIGAGKLDNDNLLFFIESLIQEVNAFYDTTDIALEIYISNNEQWDGKFVPQTVAILFPNEETIIIHEF